MRTVLLVALCLAPLGCWKTIHEPGDPPVQGESATATPPPTRPTVVAAPT